MVGNQGAQSKEERLISLMKTKKVPRERNPFLLTGKRRWRPFRWMWLRIWRDGAINHSLSHGATHV
jgi:hypothetical protein